jgi:hypothetical protein
MVRSEIAKEFGWKDRIFEADWKFIEKVITKYGTSDIIKINKGLFVHN